MTGQLHLPTRSGVRASSGGSAVPPRVAATVSGYRSPQREEDSRSQWYRLTVGEFIRRAEHQFGTSGDEVSRLLAGYRRSDHLASDDVRELCDRMGLPATDFGVDP